MAAGRIDMVWVEDLPRRAGQGSAADSIVADRVAFGRSTDKSFVAIVDRIFETAVARVVHYDLALERKLVWIAAPLPSEEELADSIAHVSADYISEMRLSYGLAHDRNGHLLTASVASVLRMKVNAPSLGIPADMFAVVLSRRELRVDLSTYWVEDCTGCNTLPDLHSDRMLLRHMRR